MSALQQITTLSITDLPKFAGIACVYAVYRYVFSNFILKRIGKLCKVKVLSKFVYRSYDLVHYLCSAILGLLAVSRRPYGHCFAYAIGCEEMLAQQTDGYHITVFEKVYFTLFASYYVVDFFYLHTASELVIMIIHHIVCLSLIVLSLLTNLSGLCMTIMILHDVVDVPLYLGKILLYLGFKKSKDVTLLVFSSMCIYFRDINLPILVYQCYHSGFNNPNLMAKGWYKVVMAMFFSLCGCHYAWTYQIIHAVISAIRGYGIRDTRSD